MAKHLADRLSKMEDATVYCLGNVPVKKCAWCKKKFEMLSPQWKYKTQRKNRTLYFCRYNCWTAEERATNPAPVLRGERVYEARLKEGKEKPI